METSPGPIQIQIPRNEITILVFCLLISVLFNTQTGSGKWSSISLSISIVILVLAITGLMFSTTLKSASMILSAGLLFLISGVLFGINFAFKRSLPPELEDGYKTPLLIINVMYAVIFFIGFIFTILISTGLIIVNSTYINYFYIIFSLLITIVIVNSGLMAGA